MADVRAIPTTRTCYLCRHTASWALFVQTATGWRCKSGGACQRRIRTQEYG